MPRKLVKNRKYHFIYKTTNKLNGRYYIGMHSTDNLEDGYLGSGQMLRRAIRKYGEENFEREILEFVNSREELSKREKEIVNENEIANTKCMNISLGGLGGIQNENHQKAFSKGGHRGFKRKIDNDPKMMAKFRKLGRNTFQQLHKEGKVRLDHFKGRKHTVETKILMSEARKGKQSGHRNSQYGTCWITNGFENKKVMKEQIIAWTTNGWKRGRT